MPVENCVSRNFFIYYSDYLKTKNNILISYGFFDGCKTSVVSRQTYKSGFFCLIYFPGEICVVGREWRSLRHRECAWSFLFFCRELTENARYKIFLYFGGEGAQSDRSNLHCFCYVMRWQEPTNLEQKKVIFSNPMTSDFTMVSGNKHYQIFCCLGTINGIRGQWTYGKTIHSPAKTVGDYENFV